MTFCLVCERPVPSGQIPYLQIPEVHWRLMMEILTGSLALNMIHPRVCTFCVLTGPNRLCSVQARTRISCLIPPHYTSIPPWNVKIVTAVASEAVGVWAVCCDSSKVDAPGDCGWGHARQLKEEGGSVPCFTRGTWASTELFHSSFSGRTWFLCPHTARQSHRQKFIPFYSVLHWSEEWHKATQWMLRMK